MHVDVVVPSVFPVLGGAETRVHKVGMHLVRLGHRVVVHALAGDSQPERDSVDGLEVRRYRPFVRRGYYTTVFAPRDLAGDVLDLQGYPHPSGDLAAWRGRARPFVTTPHGLLYRHPGLAAGTRWLYDACLGRRTLRAAARVVLMTDAEIPAARRFGVRADALRVVPSGVDDDAFEPTPPIPARELGGFDRYVLFLGRLHRDKLPLALVRAFTRVAAEHPDVGLVFAGPDDGEGGAVQAAIAPLRERALWLGAVSSIDKRRLLAGCALLALPSRFEAQGIVLIEAWAQGKPVVASRVAGMEALVRSVGGGLLHEPEDDAALGAALRALLGDPEHAAALGARAREVTHASYRWSHLAAQAAQVLAEAAGA